MTRRQGLVGSIAALIMSAFVGCGGGGGSAAGGGGSGGETSSSSGTTTTSSTTTTSGAGGGDGGAPDYVACPLSQFPLANQKSYGLGAMGGTPSITADTTWTKDNLYIVTGTLAVEGTSATTSATLTVEAGTTICFAYDTLDGRAGNIAVALDYPGALQMNGTAAAPITLTSQGGPTEFWGSIQGGPSYTALSLSYVDFYNSSYGGGQEIYSLQVQGDKGQVPPAVLDHVTFHDLNAGQALDLSNHVGVTASSVITVTSTVQGGSTPQFPVISADPVSAGSLLPGMLTVSAAIPASLRVIDLAEDTLSDTVTWQNAGLPFYSKDDFSIQEASDGPPVLTLMAGVTWLFAPQYSVFVGGPTGVDRGDLVVAGTAQSPVTLTPYGATSSAANAWGGIWFVSTGAGAGFDPTVSKVDHAVLQYGGFPVMGSGEINCHDPDATMASTPKPALLMLDGTGSYMGPPVTNTTFANSAGDAIRARCDTVDCLVGPDYTAAAAGNTFTAITGSDQLMPLALCQ